MADQKSRGGQKQIGASRAHRSVHATKGSTAKGRDKKEDARRGQQGKTGGYQRNKSGK